MNFHYHKNDLPSGLSFGPVIAVDTETMGLKLGRDRLCVLQLSDGNGDAHIVHFPEADYAAPNLRALLARIDQLTLFHFARFDLAVIKKYFLITPAQIYCTKIASKLVRTNSEQHSLKTLCSELLGVELVKEQQCSDWGAVSLSPKQLEYAASDVLYLHNIMEKLNILLEREGRTALAQACFAFLPDRVALDLAGWEDMDIFSH